MWVLPTYDRPDRVQQTLDSVMQSGCQTPGLIYIDGSNNPQYDHLRLPKGWSTWKQEENRGVCFALNAVFARFPNLPWYGFLSDDSIVSTPGWDQKLLSYLEPFTIVHSADGWQAEQRIHGAVIFSGELLRALGWWVPSGLIHSFCDDVWETVAAKTNLRRYVPEVLVEHHHMWNGKRAIDRSYIKAYSSFDADKQAFSKWKEEELEKALSRITQSMRRLNVSPAKIDLP